MKKLLIIALLIVIGVGIAYLFPEYHHILSLSGLQQAHAQLAANVAENPVLSRVIYLAIYVVSIAASIPGAVILTLAGGALFGFIWGSILVSFASTAGATLAFLIVRVLFRGWVQQRFSSAWEKVSKGFDRDGAFYLFSLRLVPVVPFFLINILMALTNIRARSFFFVSQAGMLPGTLVFVYAGTELSKIRAIGDILSPGIISAFVLIACFPWLARFALSKFKNS
jgi:uncharacterized membrane protein YdjX (TVP38/TMEM64 family)